VVERCRSDLQETIAEKREKKKKEVDGLSKTRLKQELCRPWSIEKKVRGKFNKEKEEGKNKYERKGEGKTSQRDDSTSFLVCRLPRLCCGRGGGP